MNKENHEALQYCLQALEDGADLNAVLERYPNLAEELRPLLVAAVQARSLAVPSPTPEAIRLGRQRLLRRAGELRSRPKVTSMPRLPRLAISLALAFIFLLSGTGLVQASGSTLPGDRLYPVKRTWEDMRLLLVFAPGHRDALAGQYDQERLEEVSELLQKGRIVPITFSGLITSQRAGLIIVSGVPVEITNQTQFSGTQSIEGASVIIRGQTDSQGKVMAQYVQVLPPGSVVPLSASVGGQPPAGWSGPQGDILTSPTPDSRVGSEQPGDSRGAFHIEGTIQSMQPDRLVVDGRTIFLDATRIEGTLAPGIQVEIEGYFTEDGRFLAVKIEIEEVSSDDSESDEHPSEEEENGPQDPTDDDSGEDDTPEQEQDQENSDHQDAPEDSDSEN